MKAAGRAKKERAKPRGGRSAAPGFAPGDPIYHAVFESAPTAKVLADGRGRVVLVNRQAEKLFGCPRKKLLGRAVELLVPGLRRGFRPPPGERAAGAGRELFVRRKDGGEVPVEVSLSSIQASGRTYLLAAVLDISERKKAAEMFRLAVEASPSAMILARADGRIVMANIQACRLFGYAREELLAGTVEMLVPRRYAASHPSLRTGFHAHPSPRSMGAGRDLFGRHKDGRDIPIEIGLNPISVGREPHVLAAIVDIAERRELQAKLAQNEALAAVGSMAAVMAHEIRNPLGSIVMAAKSLSQGGLSDSDRDIVSGVLSEESQRLSRTLQDFLHFSRPREPKPALADFNAMVREIVQALQADEELASKVRFSLVLDAAIAPFPHDADQLRQVLWNLVLNGIQAMGGEGRMRVRTEVRGGAAVCSVIDSGPGLKPELVEKIFDPFFTTKKKGTGLGLSIAKRIVEAHGGTIQAANEPGAGARFSVILPFPRR